MKRSTERILTTHAGSLPRPDDLRALVTAKAGGLPYEPDALARRVRSAVADVVRQQVESGIDSVNDGELSKPSFTTYVRERIGGIEVREAKPGEGPPLQLVGRENVVAGTDCGLGARVGHPSITWAKFESMAEGARLATKRLWG